MSVTTKTIKALTYICMNNIKTPNCYDPFKDFGGRIFTTAAFQAQNEKNSTLSHGPKAHLVVCVFYLVQICTFFWLNVNMYTCFRHMPNLQSHRGGIGGLDTGTHGSSIAAFEGSHYRIADDRRIIFLVL